MLANARQRFMMEEIGAEDFKAIKAGCSETLRVLKAKLADMPNKAGSLNTVKGLLDIVITRFTNVQLKYKKAPISEKREIASSIYIKNLCFDGKEHPTPYINTPIELILQISK